MRRRNTQDGAIASGKDLAGANLWPDVAQLTIADLVEVMRYDGELPAVTAFDPAALLARQG